MERKYSPEDQLASLTQYSVGSILIMGVVLFLGLGFMDYFASPANAGRFLIYRAVISAILTGLYFLNKLKRSAGFQYGIATLGAIFSGITVEIAILQSGGQSSIYYAAMIILAISCLGFAPMNMYLSFLLVGIVYSIYIIPILLIEKITSGLFISNNAFLLSSCVIGLLLRYHQQKLLLSEMKLRAELYEDKQKLEAYSNGLKDQVAEQAGALAITEQKYRALFDHANDGIAVLDANGIITDVNFRFCELHGFERESILGTNFRLLEIESRRGEIDERLKRIMDSESFVYEAEHYRKNGSRIFLEISSRAIDIGGVLHIQSFHRDITEKRKLQEQVLQSQKMESMGVLAGGIAHDFNNILTAILGHTEVLRRYVKTDDFGNRRITTIENAARRAGLMVSKLLSFARQERVRLVPTDLNSVVTDTLELVGKALIDRRIDAKIMLHPDKPVVNGDAIQLEQVIANLVMNAMDAMPTGGALMVATGRRELSSESSQVSPFLAPGDYVVLTVRDTGTGIAAEIRDRIFDPFFTTKPAGKGTGLGLATVYGIVKSHKGEIRVESSEGQGTIFEIFLPASRQQVVALEQEEARLPDSSAEGERVFVVDDEPDVLSYVRDILELQGYTVYTADNPEFAIELFQKISADIDLIITDIVMPVMNGAELAGVLKEMKPSIKVMGMTGFDGCGIVKEARHIDHLLKKPFDGTSLLASIRELMYADGKGAAAEK